MSALRLHAALDEIPAADWDALHGGGGATSGHPFVAHAFLAGLEREGCLRPRWGWTPRHATLWRDGRLVAAAPAYLKSNSHGEFVFDHAWAHAYARAGLDYFPKWLVAVPYSPVTGPRLLAVDADARAALAQALHERAAADGLSSVHVNFHREDEAPAFGAGWMERLDVQFHWRNRGWPDFAAFLAALQPKKRKNIRQERERVQRAGFRFRTVHGDEADDDDLAAMHGFYVRTFADYGNHPALTPALFRHLARTMPRQLVLFLAERAGETVAGAFCLRGGDTLYGRYWGAAEAAPGLHFETCYYQGIDYCLREGLATFEPGAQGEHKIARGFLPTLTRSRHRLAEPRFAAAIADWCAQERAATLRYRDAVLAHGPYRDADPAAAAVA
jgi:predicted N-acyltransferase